MATVTELARNYEFLIQPANGDRSFEEVTVAAGAADRLGGTVLGKLTVGGNYVPYNEAGSDGSEDVAGILLMDIQSGVTAKRAIVARDATVKNYKLIYTGTEAAVIAGLAALGIIAR